MVVKKGFFPESFIDDVRQRADILEVVSEYVSLKKSGRNFKGLCPFHTEKSPSFNVNADKGFFHCFGCGQGGNVFGFLMKVENLTFQESVRLLASRHGITVPESTRDKSPRKNDNETLFDLNRLASEFFQSQLRHKERGGRARSYLKERGISQEIADRFSLGFAPDSWDALLNHFLKKGYKAARLEESGFVKKRSESGNKFYDRFRDRLIFPFHDAIGRTLGFGGRYLGQNEKAPKYLNSPETILFKKGRIFYGLSQAIKGIQRAGRAVLVEGYFDCLSAFDKGIDYVIAGSGTALTEGHADMARRYTEEVILAFDSDPAGMAASERGFDILLSKGLRVKMALFPAGDDPDSFLRREGPQEFLKLLDAAKPFVECLIDSGSERLGPGSSVEEKMSSVKKILPFIDKIPSHIEKQEYVNILSERLDVSEKAVLADMKKLPKGRGALLKQVVKKKPLLSFAEKCERGLAQVMIQYPDSIHKVRESVELQDFKDPRLMGIVSVLFNQQSEGTALTIDGVLDLLSGEDQISIATALAVEPTGYDDIDLAILEFSRGLKRKERRKRLREVQIKKASAARKLDINEFKKLKENTMAIRRELT